MNNLLQAMQVFAKVAEVQGFTLAANQLGMATSVVTRYVSSLEAHLGVRLLQRTTRKVILTEVGAQYAEGCRTLIGELTQLENRTRSAASCMTGELHIVALGGFSQLELMPLFSAYQARYPDVVLDVTVTEREIDLLAAGYDVGIVADRMISTSSVISRELLRTPGVVVASPEYLAHRNVPKTPADLEGHRLIDAPSTTGPLVWKFEGPESKRINVRPTLTLNSAIMRKQAVLAGMGIAVLPRALVATDLATGNLVQLLSDHAVLDGDICVTVVYPTREFVPGKVRAFIDLAIEFFR